MTDLPLATLLRRDRIIVLASIAGIVALCWAYLVWMAGAMSAMEMSTPSMIPEWTPGYFIMMFTMWVIMMVGMMLPSVTPTILIFARVALASPSPRRPILRTYLFALGYLLAWTLFSLMATFLQWALDEGALLSSRMQTISPYMGAAILLAAGIYQWTPVKDACLDHCRGPIAYLSEHWRPTPLGALQMGLGHGFYCIGCCWVLMALLFAGGVMNLLVIAMITLFVLIEKLAPAGIRVERWCGGALLMIAAAWVVMAV